MKPGGLGLVVVDCLVDLLGVASPAARSIQGEIGAGRIGRAGQGGQITCASCVASTTLRTEYHRHPRSAGTSRARSSASRPAHRTASSGPFARTTGCSCCRSCRTHAPARANVRRDAQETGVGQAATHSADEMKSMVVGHQTSDSLGSPRSSTSACLRFPFALPGVVSRSAMWPRSLPRSMHGFDLQYRGPPALPLHTDA